MFTTATETAGRVETDVGIRCCRCNKLLAERASRPWRITCARCGMRNERVRLTPIDELKPGPQPAVKPRVRRRRKKNP